MHDYLWHDDSHKLDCEGQKMHPSLKLKLYELFVVSILHACNLSN